MAYSNPIVAGDTLVRDAIKSENYMTGVSGWAIFRDGTAEFNNITARGNITASSVDVATPTGHVIISSSDVDNAIQFVPNGGTYIEPGRMYGTSTQLSIEAPLYAGILPRATIFLDGNDTLLGSQSSINFLADRVDFAPPTRVTMPGFRTGVAELTSDAGRVVVNRTTFDADFVCEDTHTRPASNRVTVNLWMEPRTTVGTGGGIMSYEIYDGVNASGTLRLAASDARAVYSVPGVTGFHSSGGQFTEVIAGTTDFIFVRLMFKVTSGATTVNFARCRLEITPQP